MSAVWSLMAVLAIGLGAFAAASVGFVTPLGVVVPYAALALFLLGIVMRVRRWARAPVPFRVPTTAGQQRSLPWIRSARLDNPSTAAGAAARVLLEVLTFRSLFRNTRATLRQDGRLVYSADKTLWAAALAFHWSFLLVLLRHYRFFVEPPPTLVSWLQALDGFFKVGLPEIYITDVVIVAALGYLLLRRLVNPRMRYISLAADYFPLFLLLGIAGTGVLLRYVDKTNLVAVKELALGLVRFDPTVPAGIGPLFISHLVLVSVLFAYFPYSKLTHMAGVFISPTRNLANSNRTERHVNPWDHPVDVHTYQEWEEEFHDKLVAAGIPLDGE
jgi:nitrate reductase gamma subunit